MRHGNDGNNSEPRFGDVDSKGKDAVEEYAGDAPPCLSSAANEACFIKRLTAPELQAPGDFTQSLSLVLYELTTNTTKYGALWSRTGQVDVTWEVVNQGPVRNLRFRLEERGSPPVSKPTRKGFGSRLIERRLGAKAGAQVRTELAPARLRCTIEAPLGIIIAPYLNQEAALFLANTASYIRPPPKPCYLCRRLERASVC